MLLLLLLLQWGFHPSSILLRWSSSEVGLRLLIDASWKNCLLYEVLKPRERLRCQCSSSNQVESSVESSAIKVEYSRFHGMQSIIVTWPCPRAQDDIGSKDEQR